MSILHSFLPAMQLYRARRGALALLLGLAVALAAGAPLAGGVSASLAARPAGECVGVLAGC